MRLHESKTFRNRWNIAITISVAILCTMHVHKKHRSLAPRLAKTIKDIKAEGFVEHYRKIAFGISDYKNLIII